MKNIRTKDKEIIVHDNIRTAILVDGLNVRDSNFKSTFAKTK